MSEQIKYTFEDWWDGIVNLEYENISAQAYEIKPIEVTWDNFSAEDVERILDKQKELFTEIYSRELENKKNEFLNRLQVAEMNYQFVKDELLYCLNYMFSRISFRERTESGSDITQILQHMIQMELSRKIKRVYPSYTNDIQFINSPNSRYRLNWIHPNILAPIFFEFFEWLKFLDIKDKINISSHLNNGFNINPYPKIFKDPKAYLMFISLKDSSVEANTKMADYGFIFHKMKSAKLIFEKTKHKTFIEILNSDFGEDIGENKFPFKNQKAKITLFNYFLKIINP